MLFHVARLISIREFCPFLRGSVLRAPSTLTRDRFLQINHLHSPLPSSSLLFSFSSAVRWSNNPSLKQTSWVTDRAPLERFRVDDGEVLLTKSGSAGSGAGGNLVLEGLVSNFFCVCDDDRGNPCIRTAGDDLVLPGYCRSLYLSAASDLSIPVLPPISVEELPSVRECFITNSLRGAVEVDTVRVEGDVVWNSEGKDAPGILKRLKAAVLQMQNDLL